MSDKIIELLDNPKYERIEPRFYMIVASVGPQLALWFGVEYKLDKALIKMSKEMSVKMRLPGLVIQVESVLLYQAMTFEFMAKIIEKFSQEKFDMKDWIKEVKKTEKNRTTSKSRLINKIITTKNVKLFNARKGEFNNDEIRYLEAELGEASKADS